MCNSEFKMKGMCGISLMFWFCEWKRTTAASLIARAPGVHLDSITLYYA